MKKKLLAFLITCVMITGVISTNYMNTHALAAGATYTAYEIISMIFAVVGGTTIQHTQGLVGSSSFDENALYNTMNAQSSGIGSLLSSYVNRAQYLSPGSDLIMSDADYQAFLQYFHDYNLQNSISGEITSSNRAEFLQKISNIYGATINDLSGIVEREVNNGNYKYCIYITMSNNKPALLFGGDFEAQSGGGNTWIKFSSGWCMYSEYQTDFTGGPWINNISKYQGMGYVGEYVVYNIASGVSYKSNTVPNQKIKNSTYDTVSKSRTWDATQGKLVGNTTISMPATETLDDAINAENVKGITDAVNVYPVDTADDTMIYYPTQSVEDFIVPSITINPSIAFPGVDGSISDYTVTLTDFFPFCIPWDIYDMLSAFVTTPETPEFTFQFPTGVINHEIQWTECTFDLHAWDGVASALRTIELISFAIGLGLMTRNIFLRG